MKFKVGQKAYYYLSTGEYQGKIVEVVISQAIKDLATGKITYRVEAANNACWQWYFDSNRDITADYLYKNKKAIEKEYKEEIVYNDLNKKIDELQKILSSVYGELIKDEHKDFSGMTLTINGENAFRNVYVQAEDLNISGIGSLKEELEKLKKEVNKIKKQIKPKTKKPVIKESK